MSGIQKNHKKQLVPRELKKLTKELRWSTNNAPTNRILSYSLDNVWKSNG